MYIVTFRYKNAPVDTPLSIRVKTLASAIRVHDDLVANDALEVLTPRPTGE